MPRRMHTYMYMYVYICIYICVCIVCMYMYLYLHMYMHRYMHMDMHTHMHIFVYVHTPVCIQQGQMGIDGHGAEWPAVSGHVKSLILASETCGKRKQLRKGQGASQNAAWKALLAQGSEVYHVACGGDLRLSHLQLQGIVAHSLRLLWLSTGGRPVVSAQSPGEVATSSIQTYSWRTVAEAPDIDGVKIHHLRPQAPAWTPILNLPSRMSSPPGVL